MKLKRILMLCVAVCATGPVLGMTVPVKLDELREMAERWNKNSKIFQRPDFERFAGEDSYLSDALLEDKGAPEFVLQNKDFVGALMKIQMKKIDNLVEHAFAARSFLLGKQAQDDVVTDESKNKMQAVNIILGFDPDESRSNEDLNNEAEETKEDSSPAPSVSQSKDKFIAGLKQYANSSDANCYFNFNSDTTEFQVSREDFAVDGGNLLDNDKVFNFLVTTPEFWKYIVDLDEFKTLQPVLNSMRELAWSVRSCFSLTGQPGFVARELVSVPELNKNDRVLKVLVAYYGNYAYSSYQVEFFNTVSNFALSDGTQKENAKVIGQLFDEYALDLVRKGKEEEAAKLFGPFSFEILKRASDISAENGAAVRAVYPKFCGYIDIAEGRAGGEKIGQKAALDQMKADAEQQRLLNQSSWFTSFKQQHLSPSRQKMAWGIGAGVGLTAVLAQILHAVKDKDELVATYIKRKLGYKNLRKLSRTEEARARRRVVGLLLSSLVTGVAGYKYYQHSGEEAPEMPGRG